MNQGALPIMGYNFGAKNRLRLLATFKDAFIIALIIMIIATVLVWIFPDRIMMLFSADGNTLDMGIHAFRSISLAWTPGAFVIISVGLFQAIAHGGFALIIALVRQFGFILPIAYILLINFGVNSVWYSYPIAEIGALVLAAVFWHRINRKEIKTLPDGAPATGSPDLEPTL